MSGQGEPTVRLPEGVSVTVGGKTYRGKCPDRVLASEHKLRQISEKKKPSGGSKGS